MFDKDYNKEAIFKFIENKFFKNDVIFNISDDLLFLGCDKFMFQKGKEVSKEYFLKKENEYILFKEKYGFNHFCLSGTVPFSELRNKIKPEYLQEVKRILLNNSEHNKYSVYKKNLN